MVTKWVLCFFITDLHPQAMQTTRRSRLTTPAGTSSSVPVPQDTVTNSPSISGDLRLLHTMKMSYGVFIMLCFVVGFIFLPSAPLLDVLEVSDLSAVKSDQRPSYGVRDGGDQLLSCQFNNDGTRVAVGLRTGTIKVFSVNDGSLHHVLADSETATQGLPITSLRYMPRGPAHNRDVLLATYSGGTLKLWHVPSRTCVRTLTEDRQTMIASFNPSGSRFITGGAGAGIYMYDTQTWDKVQTFQPSDSPNVMDGHTSRVYALTFFPENDERFVSGGWDDTVQFWNIQTTHSIRRISGPHVCGDAVSIDKSGTQLLTGSWRRNNTLQIWDAETGAKIMDIPEDFRGHSQIYTCHFLGLDHIIAGGSRNNLCRLIDRRILMSTGVLNDLPGGVYSTHISARGVLAATSSTTLYLAQTPVKP